MRAITLAVPLIAVGWAAAAMLLEQLPYPTESLFTSSGITVVVVAVVAHSLAAAETAE